MWKKTIGLDGEEYDSKSEAEVANWLFTSGIEYEPHKRLPKPSRSICDFYLPDYDLWIEYDGLMSVRTDDRLIKKRRFYEDNGMKFVIVDRTNWQREILDQIELGGPP